jgi:uncharacterized protein (TIGR02246 family)
MSHTAEDEQAIRELSARWLAAEKAKDIDALIEHVTEDAVFLMPGGRAVSGKPAIRALFETFFAMFSPDHSATITEIRVNGDLAFCWGDEVSVLQPSVGGPPIRLQGFGFSVLERGRDGRWRFARGINNLAPASS